jgi:hypothetical protein
VTWLREAWRRDPDLVGALFLVAMLIVGLGAYAFAVVAGS